MNTGFPVEQREILLSAKGIGPTVVSRLEQIGYSSLIQLSNAEADDITARITALLGTTCWRNSPQARASIDAAIGAARTWSAPKASQTVA